MQHVGILGNGGQADEVEAFSSESASIAFRAVDEQFLGQAESGRIVLDVLRPGSSSAIPVVVAIGAPAIRKQMVNKWPGSDFYSLVAKGAVVSDSSVIGKGCVISSGVIITTNVAIGDHTIVNVAATISHNCTVGDYVTISPGVNIAGNVSIESGVFIGVGAIVSNGVRIASGCVVGAGAVVLDDIIAENSVVVGSPAKVIKINQGWLREI